MTIHNARDRYGRYLEEFQVGDIYKHWPGKTITESDNFLFCAITMNTSPLHLDTHLMESHQHGQILVAGTYVLSLVVGISIPDTSGKAIANLEYESIKHDAPVFIGDTVYAESEVLEVRESRSKPDRGVVYVETRALNQRDETVLTMRRRFLVPKG
jgi:acyl dehydratase